MIGVHWENFNNEIADSIVNLANKAIKQKLKEQLLSIQKQIKEKFEQSKLQPQNPPTNTPQTPNQPNFQPPFDPSILIDENTISALEIEKLCLGNASPEFILLSISEPPSRGLLADRIKEAQTIINTKNDLAKQIAAKNKETYKSKKLEQQNFASVVVKERENSVISASSGHGIVEESSKDIEDNSARGTKSVALSASSTSSVFSSKTSHSVLGLSSNSFVTPSISMMAAYRKHNEQQQQENSSQNPQKVEENSEKTEKKQHKKTASSSSSTLKLKKKNSKTAAADISYLVQTISTSLLTSQQIQQKENSQNNADSNQTLKENEKFSKISEMLDFGGKLNDFDQTFGLDFSPICAEIVAKSRNISKKNEKDSEKKENFASLKKKPLPTRICSQFNRKNKQWKERDSIRNENFNNFPLISWENQMKKNDVKSNSMFSPNSSIFNEILEVLTFVLGGVPNFSNFPENLDIPSTGIMLKFFFGYEGNGFIKIASEIALNKPVPRFFSFPISFSISHLKIEGIFTFILKILEENNEKILELVFFTNNSVLDYPRGPLKDFQIEIASGENQKMKKEKELFSLALNKTKKQTQRNLTENEIFVQNLFSSNLDLFGDEDDLLQDGHGSLLMDYFEDKAVMGNFIKKAMLTVVDQMFVYPNVLSLKIKASEIEKLIFPNQNQNK